MFPLNHPQFFKKQPNAFLLKSTFTLEKHSFLGFAFSSQWLFSLIYLILELAYFSSTILFLYFLFYVSTTSEKTLTLNHFWMLGIFIVVKYFLSAIKTAVTVYIKKKLTTIFQKGFFDSKWEPHNHPIISRLIGRDLQILLDFLPETMRFIYFPVALCVLIAIIYSTEGLEGTIALSSILFFITLSWLIAKKNIYFAKAIYRVSKNRIDNASLFLKFRAYLSNWDEMRKINSINYMTEKENRLRNKDSFWRAFDLYSILFGSTLPVIVLLLFTLFLKRETERYLVIVLWFSPLAISLIMEIGRFFSDYTLAKQAYREVKRYLRVCSFPETSIVLNEHWEIWEGSLADNVLNELAPEHLNFIHSLNLNEEFKGRSDNILDMRLSFLGKNISQGQKTKLLIIRALHLALFEKKPLRIEIPLNALDPISCQALSILLADVAKYTSITFSKIGEAFLRQQIKRSTAYKEQHTIHLAHGNSKQEKLETHITLKFSFTEYRRLFSALSFIFILPAFLLSLNVYVLGKPFEFPFKISALLVITASALLLAPLLEYGVEKKNRKKAAYFQEKILLHADLKNLQDLFQRINRDFTIMVERVSWYIHDISWYHALMIIAFLAVSINTGYKGLLVNFIFMTIVYFIYKIFSTSLFLARRQSVEGINEAVIHLQNLITISNLQNQIIYNRKAIWCQEGFDKLINTHVNMVITRASFSNLISVSVGFLIVIVTFLAFYANLSLALTLFVLNSLLMMEAKIIMLFQAYMGLSANILSYQRLTRFPLGKSYTVQDLISKQDENYIIAECKNSRQEFYKQLTLQAGKCYSIIGPSGHGKTEYLRTIAHFYNDEDNQHTPEHKTLYLDRDSWEVLKWLQESGLVSFIRKKILTENFDIIILDEALSRFDVSESKNKLKKLESTLAKTKSVLLLVDHRFELREQIPINQIIKRR